MWGRRPGESRKEREATQDKVDLFQPNVASKSGVFFFGMLVFVVVGAIVSVALWGLLEMASLAVGFVAACVASYSVKIAPQWERVVIMRFGRFHHIAGPGLYVCLPFVDYASNHVDQRIMTSSFSAEAALTSDLVPVDVDAVLFWMVWDSRKACMEVENYPRAVLLSAQTAMRDAIGQVSLGDISLRRKTIDTELGRALGEKCEPWGITVLSVEIRDITVPQELQGALSKEAQAERERNARVMLAEIEKDISEMYVEAAEIYGKNEKAMQLRAMSLAYEGAREGKGVVLMPTGLAEAFARVSPNK